MLSRSSIAGYLDRQLQVDARSLACGRIAIAALLLIDLGMRAADLTAHYTDAGTFPRSIFHPRDWSFVWSLHLLAGTGGYEAALFLVEALAGLCLVVGFHTRIATAACLLLSLSLQGRNPFLHDGQDDLLRVLLFWGLWLPWGRRWSLDGRGRISPNRVSGLYAFGLAGQLLILYESSAIGKLQCAWWRHGEGILRALQLGRYETRAGQWLVGFPRLLAVATPVVIGVEVLLPLLLWMPWHRRQLRLIAIGLAFAIHMGFWVFLRLSIFPVLCLTAWVLWLPWRDRAETPACAPLRPAAVATPFLMLAALYVVGTHRSRPVLPDLARRFVEAIGLQQYWVVFSPKETKTVSDGWFVAPAQLAGGRQLDVFGAPKPVDWDRPALISDTFQDRRWRHFDANLVVEWPRGSDQWRTTFLAREATARWLCREAEQNTGEHPIRVSLFFVEHWVEHPHDQPRRRLLSQTACP